MKILKFLNHEGIITYIHDGIIYKYQSHGETTKIFCGSVDEVTYELYVNTEKLLNVIYADNDF